MKRALNEYGKQTGSVAERIESIVAVYQKLLDQLVAHDKETALAMIDALDDGLDFVANPKLGHHLHQLYTYMRAQVGDDSFAEASRIAEGLLGIWRSAASMS